MRTTETFEVGESTYQNNMWHPDKAILNLTWLTKMCGESIVAFLVQADSISDLMDKEIDTEFLVPAVKSLVTKLNEKEVVTKFHEFTEGLLCDGKKVEYETHFMGRPGHLIKVVVQVLRAQYSDFFDVIPELKSGD